MRLIALKVNIYKISKKKGPIKNFLLGNNFPNLKTLKLLDINYRLYNSIVIDYIICMLIIYLLWNAIKDIIILHK